MKESVDCTGMANIKTTRDCTHDIHVVEDEEKIAGDSIDGIKICVSAFSDCGCRSVAGCGASRKLTRQLVPTLQFSSLSG